MDYHAKGFFFWICVGMTVQIMPSVRRPSGIHVLEIKNKKESKTSCFVCTKYTCAN